MRPVSETQPLSSVEAFALALVEASSRLTPNFVTTPDASALPPTRDDEAIATAE